jgi:hypothetical protein
LRRLATDGGSPHRRRELCRSWAEDDDFDFAARLNAFPQYRPTVDGLGMSTVLSLRGVCRCEVTEMSTSAS